MSFLNLGAERLTGDLRPCSLQVTHDNCLRIVYIISLQMLPLTKRSNLESLRNSTAARPSSSPGNTAWCSGACSQPWSKRTSATYSSSTSSGWVRATELRRPGWHRLHAVPSFSLSNWETGASELRDRARGWSERGRRPRGEWGRREDKREENSASRSLQSLSYFGREKKRTACTQSMAGTAVH